MGVILLVFYQVPIEMFSTKDDPYAMIMAKGLYFNKAAIKALDMTDYVNIRFDPETKILSVFPCRSQDESRIRWAEEKNGAICPKRIEWDTDQLFEAKGWNDQYRYKIIGMLTGNIDAQYLDFPLEYESRFRLC